MQPTGAAVTAVGGPSVGQITCQTLPPFYPGYRPYCPFTSGSQAQGSWTAPSSRELARSWRARGRAE